MLRNWEDAMSFVKQKKVLSPGYGVEDISIVMPVYNHEDTLAEAIESALTQEMPYTSKIYCFDDASTDGSGRILQHYQKRYPDSIRLYTNPENLGCGKASYLYHRPTITGRYWCILEGDDYWTRPDKLARQISFLDAHSDYAGCSCDSVMKNEVTGEAGVISPCRNTWNLLDLLLLKHKFAFYVHTTSLVWRNIYLDKGFFLPPAYQKKGVQGDGRFQPLAGDGHFAQHLTTTYRGYPLECLKRHQRKITHI